MGQEIAYDFQVGIKAVIVRDGKLLLLTDETDPNPLYDVPGGRMEQGEQVEDALARETSEELPGIKNIKVKEYLFTWNPEITLKNGSGLLLMYFLVDCDLPDEIQLSHEHTSFEWVDRSDIKRLEDSDIRLPEGVKRVIEMVSSI